MRGEAARCDFERCGAAAAPVIGAELLMNSGFTSSPVHAVVHTHTHTRIHSIHHLRV